MNGPWRTPGSYIWKTPGAPLEDLGLANFEFRTWNLCNQTAQAVPKMLFSYIATHEAALAVTQAALAVPQRGDRMLQYEGSSSCYPSRSGGTQMRFSHVAIHEGRISVSPNRSGGTQMRFLHIAIHESRISGCASQSSGTQMRCSHVAIHGRFSGYPSRSGGTQMRCSHVAIHERRFSGYPNQSSGTPKCGFRILQYTKLALAFPQPLRRYPNAVFAYCNTRKPL